MARLSKLPRHSLATRLRRILIGWAVVLCFCARVTLIGLGSSDAIGYQTHVARHAVASFKDGSTVKLNGTTTLFIEEDPHHRRVFLTAGEFRASIHHNAEQPLEVFVNHAVIKDLGTRFDVAVHGQVTTVSVTQGQLSVGNRRDNGSLTNPVTVSASGARRTPVILNAGDAARLEEQGDIVLVTHRDINDLSSAENRTAWLKGEFVSFGQRLDEVVWQFEHYTDTQILIEDSEIAQRVVGGTYDLTNVDGFLKSLGRVYGIEAKRVEDFSSEAPVYLLRHASHDSPSGSRRPRKSAHP